MLGGKNKQPLGYTIIEVMIVLAVSGVMFLIAASFVNGKQAKTAFTAGVNEMASQIQDVIEQVTDGRYSDIPLNCTGSSSSGLTISAGAPVPGQPVQGVNPQCLLVGKFIGFFTPFTNSTYEVVTLATARLDGSGNPVTTLAGAPITPVDQFVSGGSSATELTVQSTIPQSLEVGGSGITVTGCGATTSTYGFAFMQGLPTGASGSQPVSLMCENGFDSPVDVAYTVDEQHISGFIDANRTMTPATSAKVCLTDGGTQFATIDIGSSGASALSVNVIRNGTTAC